MNPCYKHPKLDSNFQQTRVDQPEQSGRQIGRIPSIGIMRLFNGLKSVVCRSTSWIPHCHQKYIMIRKLQSLNDHYLRDIGLNRADIASYVEEIFVMDTRSKCKLVGYNSNRHLNRSGTHEDLEESIYSTEEQSE